MLLTVLTVFVLCLNLAFVFLHVGRENKTYHRRAMLVLLAGLFQLVSGYICSVLYPQYLYLLLTFPIGLLYGPALWMLYQHLADGDARIPRVLWPHLLPFFAVLCIYLTVIISVPLRYGYGLEYAVFMHLLSLAHLSTYVIWLRTKIWRAMGEHMGWSRLSKRSWYALFSSLFLLQVYLFSEITGNRGDVDLHRGFVVLSYLLFLLGISVMPHVKEERGRDRPSTYAIKQETVDTFIPKAAKKKSHMPVYPITTEQEAVYRTKVEQFIQSLAYLDCELNKEKFSAQLDIPLPHVAPFLKHEFGRGFNGFINQLRLNYAAKQLKGEELIYTIEDLSVICGFSSRASFYRNFQSEFGCSPHQFRLEHTSAVA